MKNFKRNIDKVHSILSIISGYVFAFIVFSPLIGNEELYQMTRPLLEIIIYSCTFTIVFYIVFYDYSKHIKKSCKKEYTRTEGTKIKVWKLTIDDSGSALIESNPNLLIPEIENMDIGYDFQITCEEMEEEEFNKLGEFDGW